MTLDPLSELEVLRQALRDVDDHLIKLVCQRMELARQIGALKLAHSLPIRDISREQSNKERNRILAGNRAPSEFIDDLTDLLAKWSRHVQSVQP